MPERASTWCEIPPVLQSPMSKLKVGSVSLKVRCRSMKVRCQSLKYAKAGVFSVT